MSALKETIVEKLDNLPEPALRQVADYVTFLTWRSAAGEASLLSVAGELSGPPTSAEEIEEMLYGRNEAK